MDGISYPPQNIVSPVTDSGLDISTAVNTRSALSGLRALFWCRAEEADSVFGVSGPRLREDVEETLDVREAGLLHAEAGVFMLISDGSDFTDCAFDEESQGVTLCCLEDGLFASNNRCFNPVRSSSNLSALSESFALITPSFERISCVRGCPSTFSRGDPSHKPWSSNL